MSVGRYTKIESFALVDGPGVRSTLFLSGCPFRCLYCHNPETWKLEDGKTITAKEAFDKLIKYKPYWKDNGGITISGGEPLVQIDFLIELGKLCKANNISFVIDTAGSTFSMNEDYLKKFDELLDCSDLFLLDLKAFNGYLHKKITGFSNENILELFEYLNKKKFPIWVRRVLVPSLNDDEKSLTEDASFLNRFNNIKRIDVLPYHGLAELKYQELGIDYPLKGLISPNEEQIKFAEKILNKKDC